METKEELHSLLEALSVTDRESLQQYVKIQTYAAGDVILQQGTHSHRFFMMQSGRVEVILGGDTTIQLAILEAGHFFGEISCLTGDVVTATIRALDDVTVQVMTREGLLKLMDVHPAFMRQIVDQLLQRMTRSNVLVQKENLISSVLLQSAQVEGEHRYAEIIGMSPAIAHVREQIDRLAHTQTPVCIVGENGVGKELLAGRLHYVGPRKNAPYLKVSGLNFEWDDWRKKRAAATNGTLLLSKADVLPVDVLHDLLNEASDATRIILTADKPLFEDKIESLFMPALRDRKEDIPLLARECLRRRGVAELDAALSGAALRRLVLYPFLDGNVKELFDVLHKALVLSDGTTIQAEHLKFGSSRILGTKPKIGLALGAGAIRGTAHVGVLKAFEEEGIPIDIIAGTSVGSIVGALYAAGKSVRYMEENLPLVQWKQLTKLSWPKQGFLDNKRMDRWIREHIGDLHAEDLPIPFAAVATDAHSGLPVVMQSGPIGPIIRASTAIPLLMQPVKYGDHLLWDGALVQKVPVNLARSMGADIVIGVDVGLPAFKKGSIKGLFDSFMFALDIMQESGAQDELELADVLLQPTADVGGFSFKNAPIFFQKGEEEARRAIPQIRKIIAMVGEA